MALFILKQKIDLNYIENEFDDSELERAINEASNYFVGSLPHTEKTLQNLLLFYLEHPPNDQYRYILSDYANEFLGLIGNKIFNKHTHFPLRKTFQDYSMFKADNIKTIGEFELWYQYNFKNSSKENILNHLNSVKDLVNKSILRLNELANKENRDTLDNLEAFVERFKDITSKCEEITEILKLSSLLIFEINKVIDYFGSKISDFPHPTSDKELDLLKEVKREYDESLSIQNEVVTFFDLIDRKLQQVMDRSLYASSQLDNYKENFKNQSRLKLNLKKFLQFTLENSKPDKDDLAILSDTFPLKKIPFESFKFIDPKYYEDFSKKRNFIVPPVYNREYEKKENERTSELLRKQEITAKLTKKYKQLLIDQKQLDFTEHFYKILEEEKDSEVALVVSYDLMRFANKHPDFKIDITRKLPGNINQNKILIWNLKITSEH